MTTDDARYAEPAPERGTSSNQKRLEEIAHSVKALPIERKNYEELLEAVGADLAWCIDYIRELEGRLGALTSFAASPGDAQRFADAACGTDVPKGFGQHVDGTDGLRSGTNIASLVEWRDFFVALFKRLAPGWSPPMKWGCLHKTTHAEQSVPCPVCHPWASDADPGLAASPDGLCGDADCDQLEHCGFRYAESDSFSAWCACDRNNGIHSPGHPAYHAFVAANELDNLRNLCAEAYQAIGALAFNVPDDNQSVIRLLDNLSDAGNGCAPRHGTTLPFTLGGELVWQAEPERSEAPTVSSEVT